jgi:hypothetical protein
VQRARSAERALEAAQHRYARLAGVSTWMLYADAAEIEAVEGDAAAALAAQARKRVAVRFRPRRVASWDHRELGGRY